MKNTSKQKKSTSTTTPSNRRIASVELQGLSRATLLIYAIALCAVALAYSFITKHIWEDTFITLRPAENVINGDGLTFHVGTRVHTFTSPINVLLLAFSYLLTGKGSYVATIWVYRVFSIAAFAGSGVLLLQAAAKAVPRWSIALWWLAIVYMFDGKSVAFSSNGMETAFLLLFLAWAIYLLSPSDPTRWLARGLCWSGLMWSRPDGCVYIAALIVAELLFSGVEKKVLLRSYLRSAVVGVIVYGPWFFWAWSYYGTPVPNTVSAKSDATGTMTEIWTFVDRFPDRLIIFAGEVFRHMQSTFGFLVDSAGAQRLNYAVTKWLGILGLVYWLFPVNDRLGRIASFCFAFVIAYFSYLTMPMGWYYPPAAMLGFVAIARAFTTMVTIAAAWSSHRTLIKGATVAVMIFTALSQVVIFGLTTRQMQIQQAEIETGTRTQIGLWLREHGKPTDTVYLEPLGYIGYFSGMTMHDFPGLASPKVVQLRREKSLGFFGVITELMPDWVVLRPFEFRNIMQSNFAQSFSDHYEVAQQFSALPRLQQYSFIPGKGYLLFDAEFAVFRRKTPPKTSP